MPPCIPDELPLTKLNWRALLPLVGKANGALKGGLHLKAPDGTPMANAMLSMMHSLGMNNVNSLGDSTGTFNLRA